VAVASAARSGQGQLHDVEEINITRALLPLAKIPLRHPLWFNEPGPPQVFRSTRPTFSRRISTTKDTVDHKRHNQRRVHHLHPYQPSAKVIKWKCQNNKKIIEYICGLPLSVANSYIE
jgi:hypothetical protein